MKDKFKDELIYTLTISFIAYIIIMSVLVIIYKLFTL